MVATAFFIGAGFILLPFLPPVGLACVAVGVGLGAILLPILNLLELRSFEQRRRTDSNLRKIEELPGAKELGNPIDIPENVIKILEDVIPNIDANQSDDRIDSIDRTEEGVVKFCLKEAPDLQFTLAPRNPPRSILGCNEFDLARRYENLVYADAIFRKSGYNSLFVPAIKPIYLEVDGLRRSLLAEQTVQKVDNPISHNFENAVHEAVDFCLKTGSSSLSDDSLIFTLTKESRLALQNISYLAISRREISSQLALVNQVRLIIGNEGDKEGSLLSCLKSDDLISIAKAELKNCINSDAFWEDKKDLLQEDTKDDLIKHWERMIEEGVIQYRYE